MAIEVNRRYLCRSDCDSLGVTNCLPAQFPSAQNPGLPGTLPDALVAFTA